MIRKMSNQEEISTPKTDVGKLNWQLGTYKRAFLFSYGPNYHLRIEIDLVRISVAEALNMFDQLWKLNQTISANYTHRLLVNNSRRYDKS